MISQLMDGLDHSGNAAAVQTPPDLSTNRR